LLASLNTLALTGIDAKPVKVEIDIQNGLPGFERVGKWAISDIKDIQALSNAVVTPIR